MPQKSVIATHHVPHDTIDAAVRLIHNENRLGDLGLLCSETTNFSVLDINHGVHQQFWMHTMSAPSPVPFNVSDLAARIVAAVHSFTSGNHGSAWADRASHEHVINGESPTVEDIEAAATLMPRCDIDKFVIGPDVGEASGPGPWIVTYHNNIEVVISYHISIDEYDDNSALIHVPVIVLIIHPDGAVRLVRSSTK